MTTNIDWGTVLLDTVPGWGLSGGGGLGHTRGRTAVCQRDKVSWGDMERDEPGSAYGPGQGGVMNGQANQRDFLVALVRPMCHLPHAIADWHINEMQKQRNAIAELTRRMAGTGSVSTPCDDWCEEKIKRIADEIAKGGVDAQYVSDPEGRSSRGGDEE